MKKEQNYQSLTSRMWGVEDVNGNYLRVAAKTAEVAAKVFRDSYPNAYKLKINAVS